jgi:glycosyltransferase involved in cell wall biosynthesis
MISLFIFKSNARGMQYGIGTYIRELTNALLAYTNIKLYVVTYNCSEFKEFSIETISARFFKINIPSPKVTTSQNNKFYERYGSVAVKLLSEIIPKYGEVVFQMNYIDDLPIIKKLKEAYTHPIVSMVHFAQWQQIFNGNRQKLNGLNIDNPSDNIEFTLCREKEMYQLSDHIISVTSYMKDFLIEEYGIVPDKIDIVPNGIDCSSFKTNSPEEKIALKLKLGFGRDEKIIVFSGRIDPCKGILFLIDAFIVACRQNSELRLVVIGQGVINDCLKISDSFYGKITYTGFLATDQLMALYQVADMGIVPSIYDHCPYTVLEMMARKIPLIVSKINGLNEILDDNQCLFVNPVWSEEGDISFNLKELSDAILKMAGDSNLRNNFAINSYDSLIRRFNARRMSDQMNNLFHNLKRSNEMTLEYEKNERR